MSTSARANFIRNESGGAIVYDITPIPAGAIKVYGAGPIMLGIQTFIIFLVALFFSGILMLAGLGAISPVIFLGVPAVFLYFMIRHRQKTRGTREPAQVQIKSDAVHVTRRSGTTTVPVANVRRLVIGNTYDENSIPGGGGASTTVELNPGGAKVVGDQIRHATEANIAKKMPGYCYTLELQHANDNTLIADGLDELTATNLLDDMSKDFVGSGLQPA